MVRYFKEKGLTKNETHLVKLDVKDGVATALHIEQDHSLRIYDEEMLVEKKEKTYLEDKEEFSTIKKETFDKCFKLINDKLKKLWKK